jgi:GNAT superfamily N-acetyltransferase
MRVLPRWSKKYHLANVLIIGDVHVVAGTIVREGIAASGDLPGAVAGKERSAVASLAGICDNRSMRTEETATGKAGVEKSSLQIRPATEADVPLVLAFIRKLAEYGDIADEVFATEQDVREALCGPRPVAEAILAFAGGEPVGFALYSYSFSSFLGRPGMFIEDLYVETQHRGAGVGKALLVHLAQVARQRSCGRLEWSVLNWNERAMEFYQDLGAVPMEEWTTFRLGGEALERLASPEKS